MTWTTKHEALPRDIELKGFRPTPPSLLIALLRVNLGRVLSKLVLQCVDFLRSLED